MKIKLTVEEQWTDQFCDNIEYPAFILNVVENKVKKKLLPYISVYQINTLSLDVL